MAPHRRTLPFRVTVPALAALVLLASACAPVVSMRAASPQSGGVAGFSFDRDTFAFPNQIRARNAGVPDLYANYCFVLARSLRHFFVAARFDPRSPRLDHDAYVERVRRIVDRPAWAPPLPDSERVVIPGYASLRDFSRAEEHAVKAGLGGRFWTMVHWTNWRVAFPVTRAQQARVAAEVAEELRAGRLVQLLVTNWPKPELNHTVVAFAFHQDGARLDLTVWDPNDPSEPGRITFDPSTRRFEATHVYDTERGPIRAFRMYYSWLF